VSACLSLWTHSHRPLLLYRRDEEIAELRWRTAQRPKANDATSHALVEMLGQRERALALETQRSRELRAHVAVLEHQLGGSRAGEHVGAGGNNNDASHATHLFESWQQSTSAPASATAPPGEGSGEGSGHGYCYYMLNRGSCTKGSQCRFSHDIPERGRRQQWRPDSGQRGSGHSSSATSAPPLVHKGPHNSDHATMFAGGGASGSSRRYSKHQLLSMDMDSFGV
jgi:hypothetical protein